MFRCSFLSEWQENCCSPFEKKKIGKLEWIITIGCALIEFYLFQWHAYKSWESDCQFRQPRHTRMGFRQPRHMFRYYWQNDVMTNVPMNHTHSIECRDIWTDVVLLNISHAVIGKHGKPFECLVKIKLKPHNDNRTVLALQIKRDFYNNWRYCINICNGYILQRFRTIVHRKISRFAEIVQEKKKFKMNYVLWTTAAWKNSAIELFVFSSLSVTFNVHKFHIHIVYAWHFGVRGYFYRSMTSIVDFSLSFFVFAKLNNLSVCCSLSTNSYVHNTT